MVRFAFWITEGHGDSKVAANINRFHGRLMRRLACLLLLLPSMAMGADVYIDGGCTFNGNGTAVDCASGAGLAGPYNSLHAIFPTLDACGNIYHVRGVHATHGSNHVAGTFHGRYFGNEWAIDQNCDGNPSVIQPYNYATTQERVYLDGTRCPSGGDSTTCGTGNGWTQCTWSAPNCICDSVRVIGAGGQTACEETWWTTDNGTAGTGFQAGSASLVLFAQKDDGSIAQGVTSAVNMTNATGGYISARCTNAADSAQKWMPCSVDSDCLSGETCSAGASPERDCFSDSVPEPDVLLCRWVTIPTRPYVVYSGAGTGFTLKKQADSWTIRGFDFRVHRKASVFSDGDQDALNRGDNIATDNRVFFTFDTGGSDYGMVFYQANRATASNNEIAYTNSEGLHCNSYNSASASVVTFRDNYIHNQGDANVLGTALSTGTAQVGITCNPAENALSTGNLTGSVIEGNFIRDTKTYGIRMEHCVTGVVIRNNVLLRAGSSIGLLIDASPQGSCAATGTCCNKTSGNQEWYNNLIIDQGGECAQLFTYSDANTTNVIDNLKFYNITCINPGANGGIKSDTFGGTFSNSTIANFLVSGPNGSTAETAKCVDIAAPATGSGNVLNNLLCHSSNATPVTWLGTGHNCAAVEADCSTNCAGSLCSTVTDYSAFVSTSNFHILSTSPATNAGTSTGMPAGRTTDINNTLAGAHGLPSYADGELIHNLLWDIGADESTPPPCVQLSCPGQLPWPIVIRSLHIPVLAGSPFAPRLVAVAPPKRPATPVQ